MKRIVKALGISQWAARVASLGVFGYVWYSFTSKHDLSELTDTPDYRFGCFIGFLALWLVVELLALVDIYTSRRAKTRPAKPAPLPVDPQYPPTEMVYIQGEGEPEHCACHGEPIQDGAIILHWPQPAKLVCKDQGGRR